MEIPTAGYTHTQKAVGDIRIIKNNFLIYGYNKKVFLKKITGFI